MRNFVDEAFVFDIFGVLTVEETNLVIDNFKRLKRQYKLLEICKKLESLNIKKIDVIFFRFLSMFLDFLRWKFYDFFMFLITGREFDLYGVSCFCGKQRFWKNIGSC